ncbi:hypothetical protein F5Y10DRAFT_263620 [Nemania abortiva]|nr:hypothetical protein F5Y10DRAFT_263620 [Nemania abortiva]
MSHSDERVRPRTRRLSILNLPNELLIAIFGFRKGPTGLCELSYHEPLPDVSDIKSIRLTCRRFCETSSHLLLHALPVYITRPSLARLDEVSRHPTISRGVRLIKLYLDPFYDSVIARDLQAFAYDRASSVRQAISFWRFCSQHRFHSDPPPEFFHDAIPGAIALAESLEGLARRGINTNRADHRLISKAHQLYSKLHDDQMDMTASLGRVIASAMKRMPTATWLRIKDQNVRDDKSSGWGYFLAPDDLNDDDLVIDRLIAPIDWLDTKQHKISPRPLKIIRELFLSLQQLNFPLAGLDIDTTAPVTSCLDPEHETKYGQAALSSTFKQLKSVKFFPIPFHPERLRQTKAEGIATLISFLRTMLHTQSLQKIELKFFMMFPTHFAPPSMAPPLLSYRWPNLKVLDFDGPFHFEELKAIVKHLPQEVELSWVGHLLSGSWIDVLDILRERKSRTQKVGDHHGSARGQECQEMKQEEKRFIFLGNWKHMYGQYDECKPDSLATRYIQGWIPTNPVRDWSLGQLDMSKPREGDERWIDEHLVV